MKMITAILASLLAPAPQAWGLNNPSHFNFNGFLTDSGGAPIAGPVTVKFQIYDPAGNCLLYEETQSSVNPDPSNGAFSVKVGAGSRVSPGADGGLAWQTIFSNKGTLRASASANCSPGYTPATQDFRNLRVSVAGQALTPDFTIASVPFATTADTLQGYAPSDFVGVGADVNSFVKMASGNEIRFADSGNSNYVGLRAPASVTTPLVWSLPPADGSANQVLKTDGAGNLGWATPTASASQIQGYNVSNVAPSPGQVLSWNASSAKWEAKTLAGGGTVTLVTAGAGLLGGPITSIGSLSVDVGTTANKILQLNGSAQIPAVDGSLLINLKLGGRAVSAAVPNNGDVLTWNGTQWLPQAGGGGGDNLGNHAATSNIILGSNWLSGDGGSEGVFVTASGAVGVGTSAPASGAALEVKGSGSSSSSLIVPRDTTANRPSGANGMLRYNTTMNKFEGYEAGAWAALTPVFPMAPINNGSATAPTYSFSASNTTGMYRPGPNILAFSTAGLERLEINASGQVGIGTTAPASMLQVDGGVTLGMGGAPDLKLGGMTATPFAGVNSAMVNTSATTPGFSLSSPMTFGTTVQGTILLATLGGGFSSAQPGDTVICNPNQMPSGLPQNLTWSCSLLSASGALSINLYCASTPATSCQLPTNWRVTIVRW